MLTALRAPPALQRWPLIQQLATWSRQQWKVAGWSYLAALLIMGVIGETLPGASAGRVVPIQWWNYVTLALSPPLIALIVATFVPPGQPRKARRLAKTGTGAGGAAGTLAMACPVCNPLAIPIFGAAGVLSFLAPYRGLIALLSIVLLALTLLLRLRTTRTCQLTPRAGPRRAIPDSAPREPAAGHSDFAARHVRQEPDPRS
jgi:hypothetical protein